MGQKHGKEATSIACIATSHCTRFSETELKLLWNKVMASLPQLTKDAFEGALRAAGLRDSDAEILTKIFVLCDDTGDEVVDAQKFMAAASVLVAAEADRKFATAFSFYDFASSGKVSLEDAISAVTAMNCCAEWFGDVTMSKAEVEALVESVYDGRSAVEVNEAATDIAASSVFAAYLSRAVDPKKSSRTRG
eukprot:INCI1362.2.p1 GENE.INCI1362.2~~INCI1362.2.p1  ORF type:complete len:192 (+),score=46.11 INCI1362.2:188-763(+)